MAELEALLEGQDELDLNLTSSEVDIETQDDDPNPRITSISLCTPTCAHTGTFNSFCC